MNAAPIALDANILDEIRAAQSGDHAAFGRLVERTRNAVCSITLAIVRDVPASREVAQDVFVAAWRALPQLRDAHNFWPWLRQLTRNSARRHLRERARWWRSEAGDNALLTAADDQANPESLLLSIEERAALDEALARLPDEARELIVLFYSEDRSVADVSALLGITEANARKRLQRSRDRVRSDVLERLGDLTRRTAPGAVFSASVMAAVTAGAPTAAAAAGLGAVTKVGAIKGIALLAVLPGFLVGSLGILLPLSTVIRGSIDAKERRQLYILTGLAVSTLWVFCVSVAISISLRQPAVEVAAFVFMEAAFVGLYIVWLPRILRRRRAAECLEDPNAARRHRWERFWSLFGVAMGALAGAGAIWQSFSKFGG